MRSLKNFLCCPQINEFLIFKNIRFFLLQFFCITIFFPFTFSELDFFSILKYPILFERTPSLITQILLVILYALDIGRSKNKFNYNLIAYSSIVIFFYSIFVNFIIFNSNIEILLNTNYYWKYLLNIIFMIFLTNDFINNPKTYKYFLNIFLIISFSYCFSLVIGFFSKSNLESGRITLLGWKENDLSFLFTLTYSLIVGFITDKEKISKLKFFVFQIMTLILLEGVILTGTRMGIFVIISILMVVLLSTLFTRKNLSNKIIFFISNLVYLIIRTMNLNVIKDRFFTDNFTSVGGRLEHWNYALEITKNSPFFGIGLNNYFNKTLEIIGQGSINGWDPQNLFIELYTSCGIIPPTLISILITYTFSKSFFHFKYTSKLNNLLISIPLILALGLFNIWNYKIYFIFLSVFNYNDFYYSKLTTPSILKVLTLARLKRKNFN